ncbi:hypothetical protein [Corynebacterium tapiri]|uniref:Uncharacterized protein n=1 Tax=Corynebacterium tapiri TaxID=1448266 RepID=A0A5C4U836_9CORY|nr:hypothetical protein [Corynebacterium tapiri]TNM00560.1 hypothetical protein FHE74_01050 [Corynebacterium tapiri]
MNYLDSIVKRYDAAVDDERERQLLHQSSTVYVRVHAFATMATFAIMCWILPDAYSAAALLLLLPIIVAELAGVFWLRKRMPYPGPLKVLPIEWATCAAFILIAVVGYMVRSNAGSPDWSVGLGAVVGAIAAALFVPRFAKRMRRRDQRRVDASLDE